MIIECLACDELTERDPHTWNYVCPKCGLIVSAEVIEDNVISDKWKIVRQYGIEKADNLHSDKQK